MCKFLFFLFFITTSYSQKTSWGLLGGITKSFEFHKTDKNPPYLFGTPTLFSNSSNILYSNLKGTYGVFVLREISEKKFIELQVKSLMVNYQSRQDSVGNPTLPSFIGLNLSLNTSLLYGYYLNKHLNISGGVYHSLLVFYIMNQISSPTFSMPIKNSPNTLGSIVKVGYTLNRLSLECGATYPFKETTRSLTTLYYFPMVFGQLKYRISKKR